MSSEKWDEQPIKTTPTTDDEILIIDSEDVNPATQSKRVTLGNLISGQTLKATPVNADEILITDSADSDNLKKTTLTSLLADINQTPWLSEIDADSNNLINLGTLNTHTIPGGTSTFVTLTNTQILINKTLSDFTNLIASDDIHVQVRNESGGVIGKGDAVFISGFSVGQNLPLVSLADASDIGTMPCLGLVNDVSIATNANGEVFVSGRLMNVDTSAFSAGDTIYVSNVGTTTNTLTNVKPTGTDLIQSMGQVLRSNASMGVIEVISAGRVNDTPNVLTHSLVVDAPIRPTVDNRGAVSTNQNFPLSNGHVLKLELTASIDITFSDFPANNIQQEWEVEIKQDGTGGHIVTWPAEVTNPPTLDTTAGTSSVTTFRVNDGGTTILVLGTITF